LKVVKSKIDKIYCKNYIIRIKTVKYVIIKKKKILLNYENDNKWFWLFWSIYFDFEILCNDLYEYTKLSIVDLIKYN